MDTNRLTALGIIRDIIINGMKTKTAMAAIDSSRKEIDRAFIMELTYGCVRYKLYLEWIIRHFLREFERTESYTILNLMMAIYQILFMRVPDWAAVNEAVEIEKNRKGIPSLVNGVLRNYIKTKESLALPSLSKNPTRHISLLTSHPEWLISRWAKRFRTPELIAFAKSNNKIPPLAVRVNTLMCNKREISSTLRERNIDHVDSKYCPEGIVLKSTSYQSVSDLLGILFIQDEASQLVSYLLGAREGDIILDACAAPGGKSTHIAQLTRNRSRIFALDSNGYRLEKLAENIRTFGSFAVNLVESDVLSYNPDHVYNRILLDAPCSALGVIRRNPDVKYRHEPADLKQLGERQLRMLLHVSGLLGECGTLVYSVCSTEPEETLDVIKQFLNIRKEFYIINDINDIELENSYKENVSQLFTKEGYLITYPHIHDMDGFFAVRLTNK